MVHQRIIQKARRLLDAGKFRKVIGLRKAYERAPDRVLGQILADAYAKYAQDSIPKTWKKYSKGREREFQKVYGLCESCVGLDPDSYLGYQVWGEALEIQGSSVIGQESKPLLDQSLDKHKQAIQIKPDSVDTLLFVGTTYLKLAALNSHSDAGEYYNLALQHYIKGLKAWDDDIVEPIILDLRDTFTYETGNPLNPHQDVNSAFDVARRFYEYCMENHPEESYSFLYHGWALAGLADGLRGEESEAMFDQAYEYYQKARDMEPEDGVIIEQIACTYVNHAARRSGEQADRLYAKGVGLLGEIANERFPSDYCRLGNIYMTWASTKSYADALQIYESAKKSFLKAELKEKGISSYNLSCLYSLLGNKEESKKWFMNAVKYGLFPAKDEILGNKELDNIKDEAWFKSLINKL